MGNPEILIIPIIALIISLAISYYIIRSATRANEQVKIQKEQTEILAVQLRILGHILHKQGMTKADVNKIIKGTYTGDEEYKPRIKEE